MNINFNNVRRQACIAYDKLVDKLNTNETNDNGTVIVDLKDIYEEMNDLRMMIGSIAMTYEEGDDKFKDVYEELYPEGKQMAILNTPEE